MSISLVLLPLAVAAVTTITDRAERRREGDRIVCHVGTRMKDGELLVGALSDTGASVAVSAGGDSMVITWPGVTARFDRDGSGVWSAHFAGDVDEDLARDMVARVDRAYGHRVQAAVLARLRERAPQAGMSVKSETVEDDASVTLVLSVQQGA